MSPEARTLSTRPLWLCLYCCLSLFPRRCCLAFLVDGFTGYWCSKLVRAVHIRSKHVFKKAAFLLHHDSLKDLNFSSRALKNILNNLPFWISGWLCRTSRRSPISGGWSWQLNRQFILEESSWKRRLNLSRGPPLPERLTDQVRLGLTGG